MSNLRLSLRGTGACCYLIIVASILFYFSIIFLGTGTFLTLLCFAIVSITVQTLSLPHWKFKATVLITLSAIALAIRGLWVLAHPPSGTYTSQAGPVITTWGRDGHYTAEGTARVWYVVSIGMAAFVFAKALRHTCKLVPDCLDLTRILWLPVYGFT